MTSYNITTTPCKSITKKSKIRPMSYALQNKRLEILPLTGLRFFAALFVCLAHSVPQVVPGAFPFIENFSGEGMTLFFVLSGFVIHYNYSASIIASPISGIYHFLISRFARLYPLFLTCLLLDLTHRYGYSSLTLANYQALPYYFSLSQSWFYLPLDHHALIYQFGLMPAISWSISTEWFFYLAYPLICFAIYKNFKLKRKMTVLFLLFAIIPIAIISLDASQKTITERAVNIYGNIAAVHQDSFYRWLVYFSPYSRITEFLVGCLTAAIYMQLAHKTPTKAEEKLGLVVLSSTLILTIGIHYLIFNPLPIFPFRYFRSLHQCFGFAPSAAIVIFCTSRYTNAISQFLSRPLLLIGGEISYSLYLLHLPIASAFSRDAAPALTTSILFADLSRLVIALFAIFGAAYLSYHAIEMPARRAIRRALQLRREVLAHSERV